MTTDPSSGQPASAPASHQVALGELEALVASMKAEPPPLEGLASDRRGSELVRHGRARREALEPQLTVRQAGPLKAWPQT
jgi:hypothetical protein